MVGSWLLQIAPHRLWFSAAADKYAADLRRSSSLKRYAVGCAAAIFGIVSRLFLVPYWGISVPLITFYPAVLIAAVLGGFGAGIIATLVLAAAAAYLFIEPLHSFRIGNPTELMAVVLFVTLGWMISLFVEVLVSARENAQRATAKALEAQLEAESANTTKDKFLAMVSHELRTPLQGILSAIQLLRNKAHVPSELDSFIRIIERNAVTEARLVQDLLDLSKFSLSKITLDRERLALRPIVEVVLECMQPIFDEKHLTIYWTHTGPDRAVWVDPHRIQQIMMNLLTNAIKFTDTRGWIEVDLDERSPSEVLLTVSDSGIGIGEELKKDLFTPFTQGNTRQKNSGLGLGLAIVKALVELHEGTIEAQSEGIGKGTRFLIRLPVVPVALAESVIVSES